MGLTDAAPTRPSYLGLLNAISLAETRAGTYFRAWADVTPDPELREVLAFVAARETAHGEVFRQRIERLGFGVRDRDDPEFAERLRLYGDPAVPDTEKIRHNRYGQDSGDNARFFASIDGRVADASVDPLTRDTLRWYVHEERDSEDLLRRAYARVETKSAT